MQQSSVQRAIYSIEWTYQKGKRSKNNHLSLYLRKLEKEQIQSEASISLWLCGSQETVENSEGDGNTRPPDLPRETCMQVRKQQLELDMEQQTGSK